MDFNNAIIELKNRVNIVDFINQYVSLKKSGSSFQGLCPFHHEKTPSFKVFENRQTFHCFGCNESGDIFSFIMKIEHMSFYEAVNFLAEKEGISIDKNFKNSNNDDLIKKELYILYKDIANLYYKMLLSSEGNTGLNYFKNRELTIETIKKFGLGYSIDNNKYINEYLKSKNYSKEVLDKSALFYINEKNISDRFSGRVIFPIVNLQNKVIAFGGRRLDNGENKYINSQQTIIYNKSKNVFALNIARNSKFDYFILCEGYMDVITMHQAGFDNAIASLGTALTDDQAKLISRYKKKVVFSYDADTAGINAIVRGIPILDKYGLNIKIINLKPAKDPDEFIKKYSKTEFIKRIDESQDSVLFLSSLVKYKYNLNDPKEYEFYINDLIELINKLPNELVKDNYIKLISKQENLDLNELISSVKKNNTNRINNTFIDKNEKKINNLDNNKKIEIEILNILIDNHSIIKKIKNILSTDDFNFEDTKKLYELLEINSKDEIIENIRTNSDNLSKKILEILFTEKDFSNINIKDYLETQIYNLKLKNLYNKLSMQKNNNTSIEDIMKINNQIIELKKTKIKINV